MMLPTNGRANWCACWSVPTFWPRHDGRAYRVTLGGVARSRGRARDCRIGNMVTQPAPRRIADQQHNRQNKGRRSQAPLVLLTFRRTALFVIVQDNGIRAQTALIGLWSVARARCVGRHSRPEKSFGTVCEYMTCPQDCAQSYTDLRVLTNISEFGKANSEFVQFQVSAR
jgi:hypothetical protein